MASFVFEFDVLIFDNGEVIFNCFYFVLAAFLYKSIQMTSNITLSGVDDCKNYDVIFISSTQTNRDNGCL